jgi:outer membrane receptor for ferric coprogen and ferric-rhodotorulic acid
VIVVASPNPLELHNSAPNAPRHTLALWTEYHIHAIPLTIGAGVNSVSSRTASSLPVTGTTIIERAPGYTTMQLMAKYRINSHLSAQVNVSNVSDLTYYAALHPTHIIVGPARAAVFSLTASY